MLILTQIISRLCLCFGLCVIAMFSAPALADVVKPALIEISVNQTGKVTIDARLSIEALLTGINGQYKNTQEAPTAEEYDILRNMPAPELLKAFEQFKPKFLAGVKLTNKQGDIIPLSIDDVAIPEPGYTKVPRISTLTLSASIAPEQTGVRWYYPLAFGDNAVRLRQVDEVAERYHWSQWQWLRADAPSELFSLTEVVAKRPPHQVILEYIVIGFEHILPKGLDHILFILGLFLFAAALKPLLWQVTMFTLAHSVTLGLSMYGIIQVPAHIVEPLIALSIAYIGVENVFAMRLHNSRLLVITLFGLLHGLGFASVLNDFGMPKSDFFTALISFNVGVELGQLTIIALAFLFVGLWFRRKPWYRRFVTTPASLLIAAIGFYWFIERLDLNF